MQPTFTIPKQRPKAEASISTLLGSRRVPMASILGAVIWWCLLGAAVLWFAWASGPVAVWAQAEPSGATGFGTALDTPGEATQATVFVVNSATDVGEAECSPETCTLRGALLAVNAESGPSRIEFAIPGSGPHVIELTGRLPQIRQEVHIDGTSQPGSDLGIQIVLDGSRPLDSGNGLSFSTGADNSVVEGLALVGFRLEGIELTFVDGVQIRGNHIGIGADGATPGANRGSGIALLGSSFNAIYDNIIGANLRHGIQIEGTNSQNNVVARNFIGTNRADARLGNGRSGIVAHNSGPQVIGGTYMDSGCCEGNVIAYNTGAGVAITAGAGASYEKGILGNRIYGNGGLGIDLQNDGVTPNDPDDTDGDGLANRLQNFPELTSAYVDGGIVVTGTLTTRPSASYRVELFANDLCDPSGHGQGQRYLGASSQTTDPSGVAQFRIELDAPIDPVAVGNFIAATATDVDGNTSEFSACIVAGGEAAETVSTIFLPMLGKQ